MIATTAETRALEEAMMAGFSKSSQDYFYRTRPSDFYCIKDDVKWRGEPGVAESNCWICDKVCGAC